MADVIVEPVARDPVRRARVRNTFAILTFDAEGRIDPCRFERQQFTLVGSVVAPGLIVFDDDGHETVVDGWTGGNGPLRTANGSRKIGPGKM